LGKPGRGSVVNEAEAGEVGGGRRGRAA
jgi:hypothetical protein